MIALALVLSATLHAQSAGVQRVEAACLSVVYKPDRIVVPFQSSFTTLCFEWGDGTLTCEPLTLHQKRLYLHTPKKPTPARKVVR